MKSGISLIGISLIGIGLIGIGLIGISLIVLFTVSSPLPFQTPIN